MLNYLWAGMTLTGILWGALHGQMTAVTDGAIQASKEAVTLCITMLGVMTLWTGVLEIGHRSGLVDQLARRMGPVLTFLFPRLDPDGEARKQISIINISSLQLIPMNMIAYRSQYGSVNPTAIVGPALAATFISTVVAVIFCRIMDR